jgi:hypothetical protein
LVGQIQKLADRHAEKGLRTFVVYTGGAELKPAIEQMTRDNKVTIPVTYLSEGKSSNGLRGYKISPEARNTVMTYRGKKVTATFVDVDEKTFPKIEEATTAMLQ